MSLQTRRTFVATIAAGMLPMTASAAVAAPPRYRLTVLKPPYSEDRGSLAAADINNAGQVLITNSYQPSFVWQRGVFTLIEPPAGDSRVQPRAINDRGWITGVDGNDRQAFLYRDGEYEFWIVGDATYGEAINEQGVVAGTMLRDLFTYDAARAFVHRDGITTILPETPGSTPDRARSINNRNQVAGTLGIGDIVDDFYEAYHAYVYKDGEVIDIHPATEGARSYAEDINDKGHVVGELSLKGRGSRAFVYRNGMMKLLGPPAGPELETGRANAINESGVIVGYRVTGYESGSPRQRAFVYTGGRVYDLNNVTLWWRGFVMRTAIAINDHGKIVGLGIYRLPDGSSSEEFGFLLRPIPTAATQDTAQSPDSRPAVRRRSRADAEGIESRSAARGSKPARPPRS
jgi:probable HAF family extracellular repeat protein